MACLMGGSFPFTCSSVTSSPIQHTSMRGWWGPPPRALPLPGVPLSWRPAYHLPRAGPSEAHSALVGHNVAWVWAWLAQPLLFGVVGAAVDFRKIRARTVPLSFAVIFAGAAPVHRLHACTPTLHTASWLQTQAPALIGCACMCACVPSSLSTTSLRLLRLGHLWHCPALHDLAGWLARMPTAALSVSGAGLSAREKGFVTLAWLPKATVQAGLAAVPLDIILVRIRPPCWNPFESTTL